MPASPSLRLGQVLRVAAPTAAAGSSEASPADGTVASAAPVNHTVVAGESMYGIARRYGVSIKQVMEWNNKADTNVKLGEVLVIKAAK
ncbi:LysM peptidoglycan-binding domain-containing protein [Hymenobacter cellulosilyticus]|uniref:LysM peptidoglycan-binding domain-containing protein n=1 Tax=Hymenobacter cellulosilyticus TaxID=2932248 RepID=A0A8T9QBH0_9BACT|nr:LysM peptidoglycan-binding domain-containing protein [Hymenobacter cellulosilyticus]UOQ72213.1 LysM peptidoglycan-binding domain-containing protein [Hymenobacter cellulosilyticus]